MTDEKLDERYAAEEAKSYNPRQPRDDHGRWDDGAGGISQGHAAHVMKLEGISDAAAAGVLGKIKDGTHKTREDVLKHIDSIHATNGGAAAVASSTHSGDAQSNYSRFPKKLPAGVSATATAAALGVPDDFYVRPKGHSTRNGIDYGLSGSDTLHDVNPKYATHELDAALEDYGKKQQKVLGRSVHTMGERNAADDRVGKEMEAILNKARAAQSNGGAAAGGKEAPHVTVNITRDQANNDMRSVFIDVLPKSNEFRNITMNMEGRSEKFLAYRKLGKDGGVIHLWKNFHNDGSMAWAEKSTLSTTGKLKTFVREAVGLDLTEAAGHIRRVAKKSIDGNSPERDIADALLSSDDIEYSNDETEAIMDNTLINFGGEIKSVEETETGYRFGGWLVVFDKPDVSGLRDRFTKSTDFDIEDGDRRSLYYNHGLDGTIKKEKLGDCHVSIKDAGVWISGELKKRSDYLAKHVQHIAENIKQFGLSSGAPAHLVERVKVDGGHEIKKWVLSEASITPTPAEPMTFCTSLKSLVEMEGDGDLFDDEMKGYNARQPRDDHGRWDDGAGGISQGHAAHVMRSEGISDKDAAGVLGKIKDGTHKTREDVLKHIDSIHATNGGAAAGEGAAAVSSTQTALHQRLVSAGQLSQSAETGQWNFLGVYTGKTPQSVVAAARANGWKEAVGITDTAKRAIGRQQDAAALAEEAEKHGVAITKVEFNGLVRRNQSAFDSVQAKIDKAKARKSIESNRGEETENGLNAQEITKRHLPFDADQFHTAVVFYDAKSCYESGQLTDAQVVKANQVAYDADEHARNIEYSFDDEMKGDDFEDARFSIGDEVQPTVNHMPGMTKMVGKVVIVRDGNPPYYGIKFEGMEGIHKWYAEDELKAASDDDQTSSDREETSGKSNDETKYLDILSDGQREGSRFNDHSSRLLEANEEFMERVQSFMQSRAANRKSGRVLSADKHAQISEYRDGLQTIVESLSALLDEHDPNAESKSLDNEIEELEIGWMQQQLKLNDLLRKV